jgi:hypothetical protein
MGIWALVVLANGGPHIPHERVVDKTHDLGHTPLLTADG